MSEAWKLESSFSPIQGVVTVKKYRSTRSGLSLVTVNHDNPVIEVNVCVRIDSEADHGAAHALEHLVFQGSKAYPSKGSLDRAAALSFSEPPNASTHIDHVRFELSTVTESSLASLVDIYLNHIFHPNLLEKDFKTEVYNKDDESGVMFCELLTQEGDADHFVQQQLLRILFPENGYGKNSAGTAENVQQSLNIEKVRKFHETFFRPENACLVVAGKFSEEKLFENVQEIDKRLFEHFARSSTDFPIMRTYDENAIVDVSIPGNGNSSNLVYVGFRGPSARSDPNLVLASVVLLEFLVNDPLNQNFVEKGFCRSVDFNIVENDSSGVLIFFTDVIDQKFDKIDQILREKLEDCAQFHLLQSVYGIREIIRLKILEFWSNFEKNPQKVFSEIALAHFVHQNNEVQFRERLDLISSLEDLAKRENSFWMKMVKDWSSKPWAVVRARPKPERKSKFFSKSEKTCDEDRQISFTLKHEETTFDFESINLSLEQLSFPRMEEVSIFKSHDAEIMKLRPEFFQVRSKFFHFCFAVDTSTLEEDERLFLNLICEILTDSGQESGNRNVAFRISVGLGEERLVSGLASQYVFIYVQVERENYDSGVSQVRDCFIRSSVVKTSKILELSKKILNEIDEQSSEPRFAVKSIQNFISFQTNSNQSSSYFTKQKNFLQKLITRLQNGEKIEELKFVEKKLLSSENFSIQVFGDFENMSEPEILDPWKKLAPILNFPASFLRPRIPFTLDSGSTKKSGAVGRIFGMDEIQTSYLIRSCPIELNRTDMDFVSALMVFLKLLSAVDGPVWMHLRSSGLLYGFSMNIKPNESMIYLSIEGTSHPARAYKEIVKTMLNSFKTDSVDLDALESAKRCVVFDLVRRQNSVFDVISQASILKLQNLPSDYNISLIAAILAVTQENVLSLHRKVEDFVTFNAQTSFTTIVCPSKKVDSIKTKFAKLGLHLETGEQHSANLSAGRKPRPFI